MAYKKEEIPRIRGRIVWYNPNRGFGFILPEGKELNKSNQIYFHVCEFKMGIVPEADQEVEFVITETKDKTSQTRTKATDLVIIRYIMFKMGD